MRKTILLGLTATLLTFAPLAAANKSKATKPASSQMQSQQTSNPTTMANRVHKLRGTVDSVSADRFAITTKSGNKDTFTLQSSTKNANQLKAGEKVTVWYRESNGQKTATRIAVISAGRSMRTGKSAANQTTGNKPSAMTNHH